jgi:ABC-type enterochelin transport system permease subunit
LLVLVVVKGVSLLVGVKDISFMDIFNLDRESQLIIKVSRIPRTF